MTRSMAGVGSAVALAQVLMLTVGLAGGPVFAQADMSSKSPIDVTADQSEVFNTKCLAILRGQAEAVQDGNRLRADTLTLHSRSKATGADGKAGCGGVDHIEADGHVYYVTADQNVRGDHAVYDQAKDQIVLTGDVVVVQGNNVARGDRLTIKVSTHEATMQANVTGAGKPGRVRGVYYPDKSGPEKPDSQKSDSQTSGPAKP